MSDRFGRGAVGLTGDREITVSRKYIARADTSRSLVLDMAGRPARDPQRGLAPVESQHIEWHTRQVFRSPARAA